MFADDAKLRIYNLKLYLAALMRCIIGQLPTNLIPITIKTKLISITPRNLTLNSEPAFSLGDQFVSITSDPVKDLGVCFRHNLGWSGHLNWKIADAFIRFLTLERNFSLNFSLLSKSLHLQTVHLSYLLQ